MPRRDGRPTLRAAYSRTDGSLGAAAAAQLAPEADRVAFDGSRAVLDAVDDGTVDLGVVAFEDSVDGTSAVVVDHLVFAARSLVVVAEVDLVVADSDPPATRRHVAVAATPVESPAAAQTLVFVVPGYNRPGTLTEVLASFSSRGINLTKVESRPLAGNLGMYGFLVEFEGTPIDAVVREALGDVLAAASTVKFLGTFAAGRRAWGQVTGRAVAGNLLADLDDLDALARRLEP